MTPPTIVITGASSGIGLAAAEQFAARGDRVVLVSRDGRRLTAAVDRVRAAGRGIEPGRFQADFERLSDVLAASPARDRGPQRYPVRAPGA